MAPLNPQVQNENPREFIGFSQGIGRSNTFETLFGGAGDAVRRGLTAVDEGIKSDIKQTATSEVDKVQALFGTDAATAVDSGLPPDVLKGQKDLTRLNTAYQAGTIRGSHYYASLNSIVKDLRAKYPGYRDEIDSVVQGLTGVKPANALISSLRQEALADASEASQSAAARQRYIDSNEKYIRMTLPGFFEGTKSYTDQEIHYAVATAKMKDYKDELTKTQLDLMEQQNNMDEKQIGRLLQERAIEEGVLLGNVTMRAASPDGGFDSAYKMLQEYTKDGVVDTNERMQLEQMRLSMKEMYDQGWNQLISGESPGGHSFANSLDDEALQDARKQYYQTYTAFEEALSNDDFGALKTTARYLQSRQQDGMQAMIDGNADLDRYYATYGLFGEKAFALLTNDAVDLQNAVGSTAPIFAVSNVTNGQSSLPEAMSTLNSPRDAKNVLLQLSMNAQDSDTSLSRPTLEQVFSDEGLQLITSNDFFANDQSRMQAYLNFVTPEMTKSILKNNPDLYGTYQAWVLKGFTSLFRDIGANTDQAIVRRPSLDIQFNPETMQFEVSRKEVDRGPGAAFAISAHVNAAMENAAAGLAIKNINLMNQGLKAYVSMLPPDTPQDAVLENLHSVMGLIGVDPDAEYLGPAHKVLTKTVQDAIWNFLKPEERDPDAPLIDAPYGAIGREQQRQTGSRVEQLLGIGKINE